LSYVPEKPNARAKIRTWDLYLISTKFCAVR